MMRIGTILLSFLVATQVAAAPPVCEITADTSSATVHLSAVDALEVFPEIKERLSKGLAVTILHEVRSGGQDLGDYGCKVYYDLWEESYNVTALEPRGKKPKSQWVKQAAEMTKLCYEITLPRVPAAPVEVTSHLDPVSDKQKENTREWLAERGIGAASGAVLGRAVGAMVDLEQQKSFNRACVKRDSVKGKP